MEDAAQKVAERFIAFLEEPRTFDAIMENKDFLSLAERQHCILENRNKMASHFNWVSTRALPRPAVKAWMSKGSPLHHK